MFGYVKTDTPNMYVKDTVLYKAMYCGLCKGIGKTCGEKARFLLNFDLTFLSVFVHNLAGVDVSIKREHCVIHPISKRPVAKVDGLTERIARLTVILARYKLSDDVLDENKGKLRLKFFNKCYKKAKKFEPELDRIVRDRYVELIELEKKNSDSIDLVCDPFGSMMSDVVGEILQEKTTEDIRKVAYNLGKWIYLIDALDDFDKDKKKNSFNVLVNCYKGIGTKAELIKEKGNELSQIFGSVIMEISGVLNGLRFNFNHDLIDNVFYRGLITQTKLIMENKKCKNTSKF